MQICTAHLGISLPTLHCHRVISVPLTDDTARPVGEDPQEREETDGFQPPGLQLLRTTVNPPAAHQDKWLTNALRH